MTKAKGTKAKKSPTMAAMRKERKPPPAKPKPSPLVSRQVKLERILISSTNPRRSIDKAALLDLTESIYAHGVLQPVLLRPLPAVGGADTGKYEIVAGERRFLAAVAAKLSEIPAVIRELSDAQAAEIQIVENLQREDLLPLEEAAGLQELHKKHGLSVSEISAQIHKGRGYVYARMKLTELPPGVKKALGAGEISASVALLLARLPKAVALKALPEMYRWAWDAGVRKKTSLSFREAQVEIQNLFGRVVKKAPWDLDDETLHKKQACTGCPWRSGTDPELFEGLVPPRADVCTDLPCWGEKLAAWNARRLKRAAAKGSKALSKTEAAKVFQYGDHMPQKGYVDLTSSCWDAQRGGGKSKKWKAAIGAKIEPSDVVLAVDGKGNIRTLIKETRARELARAAGQEWAAKGQSMGTTYQPSAQDKKLKAAHKIRTVAARSAIEALVSAAESKTDWPREVWQGLVLYSIRELWHDTKQRVLSRRGWQSHILGEAHLKKLSDAEIRGLLVELLASRDAAGNSYSTGFGDALQHFAKAFGVDLNRLHFAAKKLAAPKKKAKPKKKPAKKKPVRKAKKPTAKKGSSHGKA